MTGVFEVTRPLPGANFGGSVWLANAAGASPAHRVIAAAETDPQALSRALAECGGLLLKAMNAIAGKPALLVRLSRFFGPGVEDQRCGLRRGL